MEPITSSYYYYYYCTPVLQCLYTVFLLLFVQDPWRVEKHEDVVSKRDRLGRLDHFLDAQNSVSVRWKNLSLFTFKTLHVPEACRSVPSYTRIHVHTDCWEWRRSWRTCMERSWRWRFWCVIMSTATLQVRGFFFFFFFPLACHMKHLYNTSTSVMSLNVLSSSPHGSVVYFCYCKMEMFC